MNLACARQRTRRMGLAAVDGDRGRAGDVVDGVENALSRTAAVAERAPSLLTSKKGFEERAPLCRLLLYMTYRGRRRGFGWWLVLLQARRKIP